MFYYRAALRTWQDPEVFEMLPGTAQQHQQAMLNKIPAVVKQHMGGLQIRKQIFPQDLFSSKERRPLKKAERSFHTQDRRFGNCFQQHPKL